MRLQHLTARDFVRQPWRNAGGSTTELAVHHQGEAFLWRASIADVAASGPFSDFAGYERSIMLLEGDGMELTFDQAPPRLIDTPLKPFVFDGGWKTSCRLLGGPVRDFNLMVDRSRAKGMLSLVPASNLEIRHAWTLVHCLQGKAMIEGKMVAAGEMVRVDDGEGSVLRISPSSPEPLLATVRIARC